ncbi:MAG: hypothetical protein WA876_06705 [Candidatus Acidiferrales bacterium]
MRQLLIAVCVLAMSSVCWAKGGKTEWQNLTTLQPGQKVQVVDNNHGKHSGAFLSVDDQSIKLHEESGDATFPRASVARVTVPAHRGRHVVLGLAIGAGAGAAIGAATGGCSNSSTYRCLGASRGEITAAAAAIGAAVGALVGALLPGHETIYRAPAQ